jgi:hypothetical protein
MAAQDSKPIQSCPTTARLVLKALVGIVLATVLVGVAAVYSAPTVVAVLNAAFAVLILAGTSRWLRGAVTQRREIRRANGSEELAKLRRELATLPETSHPLGL